MKEREKEGGREEREREERGMEEGKREGGRKGGGREEREREHSGTQAPTVYARFTFMSSSTSSLRTVMPLSFSSISATCFSIYNTVTTQQFQSYQQPSHDSSLAG